MNDIDPNIIIGAFLIVIISANKFYSLISGQFFFGTNITTALALIAALFFIIAIRMFYVGIKSAIQI